MHLFKLVQRRIEQIWHSLRVNFYFEYWPTSNTFLKTATTGLHLSWRMATINTLMELRSYLIYFQRYFGTISNPIFHFGSLSIYTTPNSSVLSQHLSRDQLCRYFISKTSLKHCPERMVEMNWMTSQVWSLDSVAPHCDGVFAIRIILCVFCR